MNIGALVKLHLEGFMTAHDLDPQEHFVHLTRQINEGQDLQDRRNFDGHVTSSFMLLDPSMTKVLMILHRGFNKWLFPGGHYEGMVNPKKSALRELEEETGFPETAVIHFDHMDYLPLDIDSHEIPARPDKDEDDHWHHDFLYLGVANVDFVPEPQLEEVFEAKWVPLKDLLTNHDPRVMRAAVRVTASLTRI